MNIKMTLYSAEEFTAAAAFCTALAEARRNTPKTSFGFGIVHASDSLWRNIHGATPEKGTVTAGEIVDKLQAALAEDADGVEFPAKEVGVTITNTPRAGESEQQTQARKRGRPRKEAPVVVDDVLGQPSSAAPEENAPVVVDDVLGQIDIEDVIASQVDEPAQDNAPQPEDPAAGWTIQDARNAGRALLDRAPDVETGNRKLAATLVPFGVQQVKALKEDQIEAFVVATTKVKF
ncbi:MAG TPA: hypothetical protein VIU82_00345 [Bosea sp. (in: a-proteobacteria)]